MSILDRVRTNEISKNIPPIRWLIEGLAKTGKSTLATSWPKPLFLSMPSEKGLDFLEGISIIDVQTFPELRAIYSELKGQKQFQTVVIDTIDAMYELCADDHTGGKQMQIQDYPRVYKKILGTIEAFWKLGLHVVLTAHVKATYKERANKKDDPVLDKYVSALPGQLSSKVSAMVDHIFHCRMSGDGVLNVLARPCEHYEAGGRIKELPAVLKVPECAQFFELVTERFQKGRK